MSGRSAPQASSSSTITACSATVTHSRPLRPLTHRREEGPMRPLTVGTSLVAGIFALGCTDEPPTAPAAGRPRFEISDARSEEHTSELQSHSELVCRLLLEKKKARIII